MDTLPAASCQNPPAFPTPFAECLPGSKWAKLLGLSKQAFHKRRIVAQPGPVKAYAFADLPQDWQEQLEGRRAWMHCRRFADLLTSAGCAEWRPRRHYAELPEFSKNKAWLVKECIDLYFNLLADGMAENEANAKARERWASLFGKPCSDRTIRRRAKRVEESVGPDGRARLEAYADEKAVPHHRARIIHKHDIPEEFIRAFKVECLKPGAGMVTAAFRLFEMDWMEGNDVPGYGRAERPGQPFPLTVAQCRDFAPSRAAMLQAGRGKFAAKVAKALPAVETSSLALRRCERIVFDDTRINIVALDDATGKPVELKSYWAMDESSRQVVGWLVRRAGTCTASDVDALVARVLRSIGIAAPGAGYMTTLKFERGTVACSPAREAYLCAMFPGQIKVSRTDMIGGQNAPGDFYQERTGNFFGKGKIESFMRTLDYFCRHIKGQRGGTFRALPAMLGGALRDRETNTLRWNKGSVIEEAALTAQAARALAYIESSGTDQSPNAVDAMRAFGMNAPLYFVSEVEQAIARVIAYYNCRTEHRMEGFLRVPYERDGKLHYRDESPNEKAARTEHELGALAPMRISPADACAMMMKARRVTVKPSGVTLRIDGRPFRFWSPHSLACAEAQSLATLEIERVAIFDEEWPQEIYLLKNSAGAYPERRTFALDQAEARFFEALPLCEAPQINDTEAMARARQDTQIVHGRVTREIARDYEPFLRDQQVERERNINVLLNVAARIGDQRGALPQSEAVRELNALRERPLTRREEKADAADEFARMLAGGGEA